MVMKLLMYAGLHDVYPGMEVNLSILKEMSAACTFIFLGENMRKLLDKKVKSMGGCYHKKYKSFKWFRQNRVRPCVSYEIAQTLNN